MASTVLTADPPHASVRPGFAVMAVGGLAALCCIGFAVVNVLFEMTGRFSDGPYAEYASGISVMNWLVAGLKAAGAGAALLSLAKHPRLLPAPALGALLWGAFALLGVYALGSMVQAVAMLSGMAGDADEIDPAGAGYVLFFAVLAAGYGVLAISHSRRFGLGKGAIVLGVLGAPVMLGLLLLGVPALLVALGLMPAF